MYMYIDIHIVITYIVNLGINGINDSKYHIISSG